MPEDAVKLPGGYFSVIESRGQSTLPDITAEWMDGYAEGYADSALADFLSGFDGYMHYCYEFACWSNAINMLQRLPCTHLRQSHTDSLSNQAMPTTSLPIPHPGLCHPGPRDSYPQADRLCTAS